MSVNSRTYEEIVKYLEEQYNPQVNETAASFSFFMRKQQDDESIQEYIAGFPTLAKNCNYGDEGGENANRQRARVGGWRRSTGLGSSIVSRKDTLTLLSMCSPKKQVCSPRLHYGGLSLTRRHDRFLNSLGQRANASPGRRTCACCCTTTSSGFPHWLREALQARFLVALLPPPVSMSW
ncbi:hypothetical protein HPB52_004416 [Rhipicephalus sanguineus]|uniref:Retrotransposon gag domain-containing protein n=1 Tax=Rhipicephalus sanguineus TaxID=34632 RepID=A0A9D4QGH0_RHISA|nr:hypothetical protein HPB52_004416 [Rhipicephalus sanguineus]